MPSSKQCLVPTSRFPSRFLTKHVYIFLIYPIRATCLAHLCIRYSKKLPSLEVSHGEVVERSVLLGYDAVSLGEWLLTFRKNVVPSFFEGLQVSEEFFLTSRPLKMKLLGSFETSGTHYLVSRRHPKRTDSSA